jgi:hypothetical protein
MQRKVIAIIPSISGNAIRRSQPWMIHMQQSGFDTLIVANSSETAHAAKDLGLPFVTNTRNNGFARGVALGSRSRDWDVLTIFNDDLLMDHAHVEYMQESLPLNAENDKWIVLWDGNNPVPIPNAGSVFVNISLVEAVIRSLRKPMCTVGQPTELEHGAYKPFDAVAISRPAWHALNGLDTNLPFCYEDADFVTRAHDIGIKVLNRPVAFEHLHAESSRALIDEVLPVITYSATKYLGGSRSSRLLVALALLVRIPLALANRAPKRKHLNGIFRALLVLITMREPQLPRYHNS